MSRSFRYAALLVIALLLVACDGTGGGLEATPTATREPTSTPTVATTATPMPTSTPAIPGAPPSTALDLPDGFTAYAIANGFYRATSIALAADGAIYVSERHGTIYRLSDNDGDGVLEQRIRFAGFEETEITGIVFAPDGSLYVAVTGRVVAVLDTDGDGVGDATRDVIGDLPSGRHQNNGMVFGPDGKLYITNGSTCDSCDESDERSATILQSNADGSGLRIYARGLRNPYDLAFDSQGRLWATDNGTDDCATIDELNLVIEDGDYGWPYGSACDAYRSGIAPAADLGLHTAATGIDEYDGSHFPTQYKGNLFLTLWGTFGPPGADALVLRRVMIEETADGPQATALPFASGFEHPIDVLTDRDGTLLVLDYGSGRQDPATGTLYRIVYIG